MKNCILCLINFSKYFDYRLELNVKIRELND